MWIRSLIALGVAAEMEEPICSRSAQEAGNTLQCTKVPKRHFPFSVLSMGYCKHK